LAQGRTKNQLFFFAWAKFQPSAQEASTLSPAQSDRFDRFLKLQCELEKMALSLVLPQQAKSPLGQWQRSEVVAKILPSL
jgi:hypothetical protein